MTRDEVERLQAESRELERKRSELTVRLIEIWGELARERSRPATQVSIGSDGRYESP